MNAAEFFWALGNLCDKWKVSAVVPAEAVLAIEQAQRAKTLAEFDAAGQAMLRAANAAGWRRR